jgi:hypothetical protein
MSDRKRRTHRLEAGKRQSASSTGAFQVKLTRPQACGRWFMAMKCWRGIGEIGGWFFLLRGEDLYEACLML